MYEESGTSTEEEVTGAGKGESETEKPVESWPGCWKQRIDSRDYHYYYFKFLFNWPSFLQLLQAEERPHKTEPTEITGADLYRLDALPIT